MKHRNFVKIASCLGIAIPASLLTVVSARGAKNVEKYMILGAESKFEIRNEITNRIISSYSEVVIKDGNMLAHTNTHANRAGSHTNTHSNRAHGNNHTNIDNPNTCPTHTNFHSDMAGSSTHTDYEPPHGDRHVNRADNC